MVNTYKHGKGKSLDDLRRKYPEYLPDPFGATLNNPNDIFYNANYPYHTHLSVTDEQLRTFSDAIVSFWKAIPHQIHDNDELEAPDWFAKAMEKDNKEAGQHV